MVVKNPLLFTIGFNMVFGIHMWGSMQNYAHIFPQRQLNPYNTSKHLKHVVYKVAQPNTSKEPMDTPNGWVGFILESNSRISKDLTFLATLVNDEMILGCPRFALNIQAIPFTWFGVGVVLSYIMTLECHTLDPLHKQAKDRDHVLVRTLDSHPHPKAVATF